MFHWQLGVEDAHGSNPNAPPLIGSPILIAVDEAPVICLHHGPGREGGVKVGPWSSGCGRGLRVALPPPHTLGILGEACLHA